MMNHAQATTLATIIRRAFPRMLSSIDVGPDGMCSVRVDPGNGGTSHVFVRPSMAFALTALAAPLLKGKECQS